MSSFCQRLRDVTYFKKVGINLCKITKSFDSNDNEDDSAANGDDDDVCLIIACLRQKTGDLFLYPISSRKPKETNTIERADVVAIKNGK